MWGEREDAVRTELSEFMPDIAMPTSSLPSTMNRRAEQPFDSPAFTRNPASINPFLSLRRRQQREYSADADSPFEQGLELDLGDGASHSGSGGNTLERHPEGQSLYI